MDYGAQTAASGRYIGAQISNAPTPVDESASPIRDGITGAEEILSNVHEAINALERRLETVLTPAPPSTSPDTNKARQSSSHLTGRVLILNDGFMHAVQRLRDLARRVEV